MAGKISNIYSIRPHSTEQKKSNFHEQQLFHSRFHCSRKFMFIALTASTYCTSINLFQFIHFIQGWFVLAITVYFCRSNRRVRRVSRRNRRKNHNSKEIKCHKRKERPFLVSAVVISAIKESKRENKKVEEGNL